MKSLKFVLLGFLISSNLFGQEKMSQAEHGILNASSWNFNEGRLPLNGNWALYENKLADPSDMKRPGSLSIFPEVWNPDIQYATYHLKVVLPADTSTYALEIPQLYCSYAIWVNGKKVAGNGQVGTTKETTNPQWLPQTAVLEKTTDTLSIVLQISNFYHAKGGAKEAIYLGHANMIKDHHQVSINSSITESLVLAVLGLSFFVIYYVREEKKKITFYFSLLCINWALRAVFSNTYAFISFFPDFDWGVMIRIEYITLFLMMIWAILFLARLFPNESSKTIKYSFVGVNCVFTGIAVIFSPAFFTQWLNLYLAVAGLVLLFGITIIIRAWINDRSGVRPVLFCVLLCIGVFGYDISIYEGFWFTTYNALLLSTGYILIFFLLGISLLYHLQIFKGDSSSSTLTFEDLYGKTK
ncbi:MAG TPA: 7TM-DISM domain-containing protein [Cyclobacteriaceae bacterium]|nr:7TM-DISM domain-containing protein [Cyclobacteriaceae bacterium]